MPTPPRRALELEQGLVARTTTRPSSPNPELQHAQEELRREREAAREVIEREREAARAALERAREAAPDPQLPGLLAARENLARELATARLELSREREARRRAEERLTVLEADLAAQRERSARALEAIVSFRHELQQLRTRPAEEVEPERLSAALERLRQQNPPEEPEEPEATVTGGTTRLSVAIGPLEGATSSDAVPRLFRSLVRDAPATAGRLVLQLLPAQPLVHLRPVAYDLVLGPGQTLQVTSPGGRPSIELADGPRPAEQTQFRIEGDLAGLARLLAAGPLRRRLSRQTARVTGEARGVQALRALTTTGLSLRSLLAAGVELDPSLAFGLAALSIDPSATTAERFSIAHRLAPQAPATATLHVLDGRPPAVTESALGQLEPAATTTVICPGDELLAVLLGDRPPDAAIEGDERPLGLLARWLEHA